MTTEIIKSINHRIRSISFSEKTNDPYLLGHDDTLQLSDEILRSHYLEYKSESDAPSFDDEDFEEFLSWLEDRYDYFQVITADAMLAF